MRAWSVLLLVLVGCVPEGRRPGTRAPLSASCDAADPLRCGLPWPSDTFTVVDPGTRTGLRVAASPDVLAIDDALDAVNGADGFSIVNPIVTAFAGRIDVASLDGAMRLFVAQPGEIFATEEPLGFRVVVGNDGNSLVIAFPKRPLAFASEHVVVLTSAVRFVDGSSPVPDRIAQLSSGVVEASGEAEAARVIHTAPTRSVLEAKGISPESVIRTWSFTTRSAADVRRRLVSMRRSAVEAAGQATVKVLDVQRPAEGPIAAIVLGELQGLPKFRETVPGPLAVDQNGIPVSTGTTAAPFRVVIPRGEGSYRAVLYGHGTGGNVGDRGFDAELAARGWAKVGVRFDGWTDETVVATFGTFTRMLRGVQRSTAGLMQSLAELSAIEAALTGPIADTLALAEWEVDGTTVTNPAAGRRIDVSLPVWAGGSLGGCMGFVHANLSEPMRHAVLNVPGAGWTHFLPQSALFDGLIPVFIGDYKDPLDLHAAIAMSQLVWDEIDGANYPPDAARYLVQQSIGDPVLPAAGTTLLANAIGAVKLGAVLEPVVGLRSATGEVRESTLTQFKTDRTGPSAIHGFADTDTRAGRAARQQVADFLETVFEGDARVTLPAQCVANSPENSCDFSAPEN